MNTPVPTVKLGDSDVASVILGQSPPSSVYNEVGDGLPFFQGKADFGLLHPMPRVWCRTGQKFASSGDVLISVRAPVGDVNVATDECVIGRGISAIRAESRTDPWFLYFALLYAKPVLESRATGSTFASVNKATLLDLDIPFPDKSQQSKIGLFLHNLVKQIEQETLIIAVAQDLKKAAMRILLTYGLRGEAQKETEIGPVPENWELIPCDKIFKLTSGRKRPNNLSDCPSDDKPFPVLGGNGVMGFAHEWHLDSSKILVIGRVGEYCGAVHIASGKIWVTDNALYAKEWLNEDADLEFVGAFLSYFDLNRFKRMAGQPLVTQGMINEHSIPLPTTLAEQREIVAVINAIDRKINLHRRKRAVFEELLKALLHKLMTGQIRVADLDLSDLSKTDPISSTEKHRAVNHAEK